MRNLILFDDESRDHLLPLTFTRPVSELRCGILTIREKWEAHLKGKASYITSEYLAARYPIIIQDENLVINGAILPNTQLVKLISDLKPNEALTTTGGELVAANIPGAEFDAIIDGTFGQEIAGYSLSETPAIQIRRSWDLLRNCANELQCDFDHLTRGRIPAALDPSNTLIGSNRELFIGHGASVTGTTINTLNGPVYIGSNATVMEGSNLRGPVAVCDHAVIKMGARIYGPSVIGPWCKAGGEVSHSILLEYANKAHDGYLGDSILGAWCNIGAGTNISNLKNNYTEIRMWNYVRESFEHTGRMFLGIVMGDHSKCGIGTMFNTGTTVGVSANIFGEGYPRTYIPSFSWGGPKGWQTYQLGKALVTAEIVMARRDVELTETDRSILTAVFTLTAASRPWEKQPSQIVR